MDIKLVLKNHWIKVSLLIICISIAISVLWYRGYIMAYGRGDFTGYWSAEYLFRNGRNPYNPQAMLEVQRDVIQSDFDFVMMAWNPPSLFIFLLPVGGLPFDIASATWFSANILFVVVACFLLAKTYFPEKTILLLVFCLLAILFPPVLSAIMTGQVTFLVLLGLSASLFFIRRQQFFGAGISLLLVTVKPHLVILPVVYLVLIFFRRDYRKGLLGLLTGGMFCITLLFLFRPSWLLDFWGLLNMAPINWLTPTLGGLLSYLRITEAGRYLIFLWFPFVFYLSRQTQLEITVIIPFLVLLTVPFTFFGWSYDQSILLIPIAQIFGWLAGSQQTLYRVGITLLIVVLVMLNYVHRVLCPDELYYLWVPIAWGFIYGLTWWFLKKNENPSNIPTVIST